jgi:hypothetical protein
MSKSITVPFKIPFTKKFLKQVANFFDIEIIEKITTSKVPATKMSATKYIQTIPQQRIEEWNAKRRNKDGIEVFKNQVGFHIKKGREGFIYYIDNSNRVCECWYEMSGVSDYDILVHATGLNEWFLPTKKTLSPAEKNEIITKMKIWLAESKIKANFY